MTVGNIHYYVEGGITIVDFPTKDKKLEGVATVLYLAQNGESKNKEKIIENFKKWSEDKANRFSEKYRLECIDYLEKTSIILDRLQ